MTGKLMRGQFQRVAETMLLWSWMMDCCRQHGPTQQVFDQNVVATVCLSSLLFLFLFLVCQHFGSFTNF